MDDFTNVTSESMKNYHFLWYTFNNRKENLTFFCKYQESKDNCTDQGLFTMADTEYSYYQNVIPLRKNPSLGKVIEEAISQPPCASKDIKKKFKIEKICNLHQQIREGVKNLLNIISAPVRLPTYPRIFFDTLK